jgi:hypothetical protein
MAQAEDKTVAGGNTFDDAAGMHHYDTMTHGADVNSPPDRAFRG